MTKEGPQDRNTLSAGTTAVPRSAATLVKCPLAKAPMVSGRRPHISNATNESRNAIQSTTG